MSREAGGQDPLQVLYLGSSADVVALRRSMEAHGAVTRIRLTPEVVAVVADGTVPAGHPTVRAAATLGVPVLDPSAVIEALAGWIAPLAPTRGSGEAVSLRRGGPPDSSTDPAAVRTTRLGSPTSHRRRHCARWRRAGPA